MSRDRDRDPVDEDTAGLADQDSLETTGGANVSDVGPTTPDAARLYDHAFVDDPKVPADLANNPPPSHHDYAACCAALASSGQGPDAPTDPARRAALRGQSLAWLHTGFAQRRKQAASDNTAERRRAADALNDWLSDSEGYGFGPEGFPKDLLADEQLAWESLWTDVRATLAAAQKPIPPALATTKR